MYLYVALKYAGNGQKKKRELVINRKPNSSPLTYIYMALNYASNGPKKWE